MKLLKITIAIMIMLSSCTKDEIIQPSRDKCSGCKKAKPTIETDIKIKTK